MSFQAGWIVPYEDHCTCFAGDERAVTPEGFLNSFFPFFVEDRVNFGGIYSVSSFGCDEPFSQSSTEKEFYSLELNKKHI